MQGEAAGSTSQGCLARQLHRPQLPWLHCRHGARIDVSASVDQQLATNKLRNMVNKHKLEGNPQGECNTYERLL